VSILLEDETGVHRKNRKQ